MICADLRSPSLTEKGAGKKKTKTKPSQICKKYLGIDLASAFTLLTAAEEKNSAAKPPKSFNALPLLCCGTDFQRLHCISEDETEEEIEI